MADLNNLVNHIEENTRSSSKAGLEFIDPNNYQNRLKNKQNHVVLGRRGSGKTTLMNSLNDNGDDSIIVMANLEDYKNFSFPNVLIKVLSSILDDLKTELKRDAGYNPRKRWQVRDTVKKIERMIEDLEEKFLESDSYEEDIVETKQKSGSGSVKDPTGAGSLKLEESETLEKQRKRNIEKSEVIQRRIDSLKQIINETSDKIGEDIFLILDDFYFVDTQDQPFVADFFHRLTKDTDLYLKIATIRHRSNLYVRSNRSFHGVELGHDAQKIDLDYSLDRFNDLKDFMRQLLNQAIEDVGADLDIDSLLTEKAFNQLCLAAGGVPRDFLSLFVDTAAHWDEEKRISKPDVTETAIRNFTSKQDSFERDSAEEKEKLELYLEFIKRFCVEEKRKNIFLVSNERIDDFPDIEKAVGQLMDLRMIHLVDPATSCAPSDGTMYSAYMVDIGMYSNSKPRNFDQIDPGVRDEKEKQDKVRAAPIIDLEEFEGYVGQRLG